MKVAAATVALLVSLVVAGLIGLAVGDAVPDHWVADALLEARQDGALTNDAQAPTALGGVADQFTECITISVGLGDAEAGGLLERVALGTNLKSCPRLTAALDEYATTGRLAPGSHYLRYWHGTSVVDRPILALLGLPALRIIAFFSMVVGLLILGRQVSGSGDTRTAFALLAPVVVTTDLVGLVSVSHHAIAWTVAFLGAAACFRVACEPTRAASIWLTAVTAGAAFVYVDLLTVVPGAWVLASSVVMLAATRGGAGLGRTGFLGLLSGVGWLVGYAGMWVGKWIYAASVLDPQLVSNDVSETISRRIDGDSPWSETRFGAAIEENLDAWFDQPLTAVGVLVTLVLVIRAAILIGKADGRRGISRLALLASPALVPLVWFEVLSNHSQIHHWFTYRSLAISLGVVAMAAVATAPPDHLAFRTAKSAPARLRRRDTRQVR